MSIIDQAILRGDRRGMARIAAFLANNYCAAAAGLLVAHFQRVLILTGFYVGGIIETDGPPGAVAIARSVVALGGHATIVADCHGAPILGHIVPDAVPIEEFPIAGVAESVIAAADFASRLQPTLVISVERCGATSADRYLNMRGEDITAFTARLDSMVALAPSIAIGDGGNEIGMGNVAALLSRELAIADPCVTGADHLILCAVSNWGAYGLIAATSLLTGMSLLPSSASEEAILRRLVQSGAVDGITGASTPTVDGFDCQAQRFVLDELREAVSSSRR